MQFKTNVTISSQIVEYIKDEIFSSNYLPGQKIPAIREFATQLCVNPNTVVKAVAELEKEGLIFTESTNGKYVTEDKVLIQKAKNEFILQMLTQCRCQAERYGFSKLDIEKLMEENQND